MLTQDRSHRSDFKLILCCVFLHACLSVCLSLRTEFDDFFSGNFDNGTRNRQLHLDHVLEASGSMNFF